MKERSIRMTAPEVRAILAGTKTQTRRVVKATSGPHSVEQVISTPDSMAAFIRHRCPYGQPGDRLWVREEFMHEPADYYCWEASVSIPSRPASTVYRADFPESQPGEGWKPSIHLPRRYSRITLEVAGVRVERLQEISEADAKAEGVSMPDGTPTPPDFWSYQQEFRHLWEQINGPGSWDANPWVWAISFRRIEP